ncbi:MAG: DUF1972 domain-containing protein, partial [Bacteroidota bacterium]
MESRTKVAIIGSVGIPARYGGFETLVHHLVLNLADRYELTVFNSGKVYQAEDRVESWQGAKMEYLPLQANGIQSIPYDLLSMQKALSRAEVWIILGVSGCMALPIVRRLFPRKKLIVNIDGLEWRRPKWGKRAKAFLHWSEGIAVRNAHKIVADNQGILEYVQQAYDRQAVDMIAYGGDHVQRPEILPADLAKFPFLDGKYTANVARIEPENNLHVMLEAYAQFTGYPLAMVGNWEASAYGRDLKAAYQELPHLFLIDYIADQRLLDVIRSHAWVYLHGHSAGGTNPALVEAMNLGRAVLAFDVNFNRYSTQEEAMYWANAEELLQALRAMDAQQQTELGNRML